MSRPEQAVRFFRAILLCTPIFILGACRDEAPADSGPEAIKASLKIERVKSHATTSTPAHACAHAPHLVLLTRGDSAVEHAIAQALAPELAAAPVFRSARLLPGPGSTPAEVILIVDASEALETQSGRKTKLEGLLSLRFLSHDALGGLARKVRGRIPRPSFDHEIQLKLEASARAASPQLARAALAEALALDQAPKLANLIEGATSPLPWVSDPTTDLSPAVPAELPALDREEIRRLGGGQTATGDFEAIYRVSGDQGRGPFTLDLMANLQKAGFRTLTRRTSAQSSVLAMRDDRRQITLSLEGEDPERGLFRGFMLVLESPAAAEVEARLDLIAAGAAPVPALLALRRDLGPPRFEVLAKTLRERRAKWGLDVEAELALAEIERSIGEDEAAGHSLRRASRAAWMTARKAEEFPGVDLLARNLGEDALAESFAQAPAEPSPEDQTSTGEDFIVPVAGDPLVVDVPATESAFIVLQGAGRGILQLKPGPADRMSYTFFAPHSNGAWGPSIAGTLRPRSGANYSLPTCNFSSETLPPDHEVYRIRFTPPDEN
jgi:hypothetical protein